MKSKKYWLKGLIGGILIAILYFIMTSIEIGDMSLQRGLEDIFEKFYFFDLFGSLLCGGICKDFGTIIYFITIPASYGIIGLIIGLVYGKVKNRNIINL